MRVRRAALIAALLASGCSMAPKYERPQGAAPASFPTGEAYATPANETLPAIDRAAVFKDPRLLALMDQALVNNRDLRVAAANIVRARAQFSAQRASLFPELDAGGQIQRTENATVNATTVSGNFSVPVWEIDLFGRIQSLSTEAQERYFATEATARATRLALLGDIANAWLAYAADKSLLTLAQSTAESARRTTSLVDARLKGGIATGADSAQAQTILANAESDLARQKTLVAQDLNLLTLLVGATVDPQYLPENIEQAGSTIGDPPTATSSEVLLRRPDVLSAEYNLRAANADIGAARAALFPRITLSGLIGLAAGSLEGLFGDAGRSALQDTAAGSYPIFRAGAGRANLTASKAQRDAALATYEKSIQTAFREVADALARRGTMEEQLGADTRRAAAAGDAYRLSDARYRGGIDSFLVNLDSQRSLYAAQKTLVATRLEAARNRVALYRTLGGDALTPAADEPAPVR
jgi:multidrug efflux system outer membrane protein